MLELACVARYAVDQPADDGKVADQLAHLGSGVGQGIRRSLGEVGDPARYLVARGATLSARAAQSSPRMRLFWYFPLTAITIAIVRRLIWPSRSALPG